MTDVSKIIDADQAYGSLIQAVEERGHNYVYSNPDSSPTGACVYAANGKPMCGVGLALHKAGIPIDAIAALDTAGRYGDTVLAHLFAEVQPVPGYEFTEGAAKVFAAFQENQDSLETWGVSLEAAEDTYHEVTA